MSEITKYEIAVSICPKCGETTVSFPWVPIGGGMSVMTGYRPYCACDRAASVEALEKMDEEFSKRCPEFEHAPFSEGPNVYEHLGELSREMFRGKEGQNFEITAIPCEKCGMSRIVYPLVEVSLGNFMKAGKDIPCDCENEEEDE